LFCQKIEQIFVNQAGERIEKFFIFSSLKNSINERRRQKNFYHSFGRAAGCSTWNIRKTNSERDRNECPSRKKESKQKFFPFGPGAVKMFHVERQQNII